MKSSRVREIVVLSLLFASAANADDEYPLGPDSLEQQGVAKGEIHGPLKWTSEIFPGTERDYWIYVPSQYEKEKPACVMVVQDGLNRANGWKLTTVMDNLIHKREMPVTIGIFVNPGVVPAPHEKA